MLSIRLATAADGIGLLPIQRELQTLHIEAHPKIYRHATDEQLMGAMRQFFDMSDTTIWAAFEDAEPLGYAILKMVELPMTIFSYARKIGHLDQLAILRRAQRRGIGSALLKEAIHFAQQQGCSLVRLEVLGFNDGALQFYLANGFATSRQQMTIDLPLE